MSRSRRLLIMFGIALLLAIAGYLLIPPTTTPGTADAPANLFALMLPFILIFVAIILAFITFIIVLTTALNDRVSNDLHRLIERALIAGIILGVIGMIQPWVLDLFKWGFLLLLFCTLAYIVWSHIVPRGVNSLLDAGTVSATDLEMREAITGK